MAERDILDGVDLIVASTTDTQEEVDRAAGKITPAEPPAKPPAKAETATSGGEQGKPPEAEGSEPQAEPEAESAADAGAAPPETEKETEKGEAGKPKAGEPKPPKRADPEKRIAHVIGQRNKIRDEFDAFRGDREALRKRLAELEGRDTPVPAAKPPEPKPPAAATAAGDDPEPVEDHYETYAEYTKALAKWQYRQDKKQDEAARAAEAAESAQRQEAERRREAVEQHTRRCAEAAGRHEDWDDAVAEMNAIPIPGPTLLAITEAIVESELGGELVYHLGTHPEKAKAIAAMTPPAALREVLRLEAELKLQPRATANPPASPHTEPRKSPPAKPAVTQAQPPITPVGGGGARAARSLEDLPIEEYILEANARERRQGR